jgi:regulator of RNase E activity RraA
MVHLTLTLDPDGRLFLDHDAPGGVLFVQLKPPAGGDWGGTLETGTRHIASVVTDGVLRTDGQLELVPGDWLRRRNPR